MTETAATSAPTEPLLEMKDVHVAFTASTGIVEAVRGFNLTIYPGQTVAIVGESGSGKSTSAMSILGLLPGTGRVTKGQILFEGTDIAGLSDKEMQKYRGSSIGLVPQDPMSNLNPVWRVGTQIEESLKANNVVPGSEISTRVHDLLREAGLNDVERAAKQYPHEFSGGMRQRALIAIGLAANPRLLIADELTSALDVTVQKQILDHLEKLAADHDTAVLFITHDLGLAAERAEHLVVMHRGRVVEAGPSMDILRSPQHPYTQRLVAAAPSLASARIQSAKRKGEISGELLGATSHNPATDERVIEVKNLVKEFPARGSKKTFRAVNDVSFYVRRGTTTALVGESGSGKSTVANMVLGLLQPTSGSVHFNGQNLDQLSSKEKFQVRRRMQVVFQNPYASLNPMFSIYRCIEEPLVVHKIGDRKEREEKVAQLLDMVAMPRSAMRRYPNELSGGQRQRIAIARALALNPEVIVLDEAVSALDVVVQNQILNLLAGLQEELKLSYLFITHDLAVVRQIADDVIVMEQGNLVERGTTDDVFANPRQEYTRNLIESVPGLHIELGSGI
ncbi:dipeptide ABC transporter ATP-binding protein [Corynebacterium caspium]|uniref:dipeptide ABC transporter ATP-binding protein n=1 Tax=Corynebacterium caspium TaxID=234828 RepID=UPI0003624FB4|nr:ABC transporter ATP-binding protein [Corynebacterium caspium]WKD59528.1 Glutathione import ATP-binding protein GsiA [Corynebacterium caspium DSM 44850]